MAAIHPLIRGQNFNVIQAQTLSVSEMWHGSYDRASNHVLEVMFVDSGVQPWLQYYVQLRWM